MTPHEMTHTLSDEQVDNLLRQYYRHVPADEVESWSKESARGAALSHHELALHRPEGTSNVRAFTPTPERDGWGASGHIIVEIVTGDRPFLVDSVTAFLVQAGYGVDRVIHPQLVVTRDVTGTLQTIESAPAGDVGGPDTEQGSALVLHESWMHLELDSSSDPEVYGKIEKGLQRILRDVQEVVEDWAKMQAKALEIVTSLRDDPPPVSPDEVDEASELLSWLADGHFTFMGYREYELDQVDGEDHLRVIPATGLGILRSDQPVSGTFSTLPSDVRAKAREKSLLIVTKANSRATVHRPVYLDYISVKTFGADGEVVGERRFLGLFTSSAYTESVTRIPVLGRRVGSILNRLAYAPDSYNGKALVDLLETYPRDELFQTPVEDLARIADDILQLRDRRQLRLFLRRDDYGRFMSCLVYLPRDRYTTAVRLRMQKILESAIGGEPSVDYTAWVTESLLARVHFVVRPQRGHRVGDIDESALERRLTDAIRSWEDDFARAIDDELGEAATTEAMSMYAHAFPEAYKEDFSGRNAVSDLQQLESLHDDSRSIALSFAPGAKNGGGDGRLKIYRIGEPLSLTDVLPFFSALGVDVIDERPYHITRGHHAGQPGDPSVAWIYDFGLRYTGEITETALALFEDAFLGCWSGLAEADGFNRLVLGAGLTWRQVVIVRAYAKYMRQVGTTFSQDYIEASLLDNADITTLLVKLFETRFGTHDMGNADLESRRGQAADLERQIDEALDAVESLDADRILRTYRNLIRATLRTNFYQSDTDGRPKPYMSIKLEPRSLEELPEPRPRYEIFCYSPRVEGVHLRFGPVARGGLRWSDRREDFRTEVLGLVKAQMVKNTVIVPVGSKGGFYCKELPDPAADREAWLAEGIDCYKTFISSLLDITDNRSGAETIPPKDVVRWDGDDSYLVVAADKGTASFSDIANGVSIAYGFWLGDAFASGGSDGYDHKAMGITARGAWESVRRHFREMGVDCQNEDFTTVGVGDMSGDVFGNGMLLSRHTRLVAAFDHRHIFLDPDPDAVLSFPERERLFALPRSSWADYDTSLISEGGGVFPRSLKSVPISPQIRTALGLDSDVERLTPPQLLTAILKAPVDLLWNGGIGTYVKAASESHDEVGDKANNAIRVDGTELRCRCVGEGGNLGLTQLGRIEYARAGGRINTDFIDNSAGVDTSDHEVNIKILLDRVVESGQLTREDRNNLLPTMTDEVASLVLGHNYEQNKTLANAAVTAPSLVHAHADWIRALERDGLLDRTIEFLPSDERLTQRRAEGVGLSAPELAVVLAYTKIVLADALIGSDIADEPFFRSHLYGYFPTAIKHHYRAAINEHPLRREIIVTKIVNELVDTAGMTFYHRLTSETGASAAELARAHAIAIEIYGSNEFSRDIDVLDNVVDAKVQTEMRLTLRTLNERVSRWLVNNTRSLDAEETVEYFGTTVQRIITIIPDVLVGRESLAFEQRIKSLTSRGVPEPLARRAASIEPAYPALGIAHLATTEDRDPVQVAAVHYAIGEALGLDLLAARVQALPRDDRWRTMARSALRDEVLAAHTQFTASVLAGTDDAASAQERVDAWVEKQRDPLTRAGVTLDEIWAEETPDLARLSVALRIVRSLLT